METIKVCVNGSRSVDNYPAMRAEIISRLRTTNVSREFLGQPRATFEIISGGAGGADKLAERMAKELGFEFTLFKAEWELWGKGAGVVRSKRMAEYSDVMYSFWDGQSKGTLHAIKYMLRIGKTVRLLLYGKSPTTDKIIEDIRSDEDDEDLRSPRLTVVDFSAYAPVEEPPAFSAASS